MDCPNCGLLGLPDQKFCRACGASLQLTTQPLAEPATAADLERKIPGISNEGEQRPNRLVLVGFISMFIGAAIGIVGKKLLHEDIVTVIGVLVALFGMFLTAYPYLWPSHPKQDSSPALQPKALAPSQPATYLPAGNIDYVPSITERTTDLLKNPVVKPKKEEDQESHP